MTNEIKILCPSRKCGKCRSMINLVEEVSLKTDPDKSIVIEDNLSEILIV